MVNKTVKPNIIQNYFDKRLGAKIVDRIKRSDKSLWLYYHHEINNWGLPPEFYDLMPRWMRRRTKTGIYVERHMTIYRIVSAFIRQHFTHKDELRYHNVVVGRMSKGEFDYWYDNCFLSSPKCDDEAINKFYDRRNFYESIEWWRDDVFIKIKGIIEQPSNQQQTNNQ